MLTTIMCDGAELRERRELRGHGNSHGNKNAVCDDVGTDTPTIMHDAVGLRERGFLGCYSHGNKCGGYVSQVICRFFLFNEIKDLRVFRFFFEAKSTKYVAYMTTI